MTGANPAGVRCFMLEDTDTVRLWLRRYAGVGAGACPLPHGDHNARSLVGDFPAREGREHASGHRYLGNWLPDEPQFSRRTDWPERCECGFVFSEADNRQVQQEAIYRHGETGTLMTLRDAPPGAMWDAWWCPDGMRGADGLSLVVKCPDGHEWCIDSEANNCTMKGDRAHRCWIRHGTPPRITVDKRAGAPGASATMTCGAGAGSIATKNYHGFLTDSQFRP